MSYILWFDEYKPEDGPRLGGKNVSLGVMIAAGLPVPPGFGVTTEAYGLLRNHRDLNRQIGRHIREIDLADPVGLAEISREIRRLHESIPIDPEVEGEIRIAYERLGERCGLEDVPVAVRSSATSEDLPDASFAGEHDTFLWVRGGDEVVRHVRRCWSSVFTDRAISYRHEMGHGHDVVDMSVGVQKMVDPKAAGVAFTLNPSDGDRSQIAIDASWGLGEAVVGGEVTPDNFMVDKVIFEIVKRTVSPKNVEYRLNRENRVELCPVEPERRTVPCLTDDEVKGVARMAREAERHYGHPQDVEWAIDRHLPDGENIILLQSRPETVWSRKQRATVANPGGSFMEGIVSTLLSPIHTREASSTVDVKEEGEQEEVPGST